MASKTGLIKSLPDIPKAGDPQLLKLLEAIKSLLEVREGVGHYNMMDMNVTFADLQDYHRGSTFKNTLAEGPRVYPSGVPKPPTNLVASVIGSTSRKLTWTWPLASKALDMVEVYLSWTMSRSEAQLIARVTYPVSEYSRGGFPADAAAYFWIRIVRGGSYSPWEPPDSQGGYVVVPDEIPTVNDLMNQLTQMDRYTTSYTMVLDAFQIMQPSGNIPAWIAGGYDKYEKVKHTLPGPGYTYYQSLTDANADEPPSVNWLQIDAAVDNPLKTFTIGNIDGIPSVGVHGDLIVDGSLLARHLSATEIYTVTIASSNYVPGVDGWKIDSTTGVAEFNNFQMVINYNSDVEGIPTSLADINSTEWTKLNSGLETWTTTNFIDAVTYAADMSDLQSQIDGAVETWFYEGTPGPTVLPESAWLSPDTRDAHKGDLYFDMTTGVGLAYRYFYIDGTGYVWQEADTATAAALALAQDAFDLADHKRRVFLTEPVPPYDTGDLWLKTSDEIWACVVGRETGVYTAADWAIAATAGAPIGTSVGGVAVSTLVTQSLLSKAELLFADSFDTYADPPDLSTRWEVVSATSQLSRVTGLSGVGYALRSLDNVGGLLYSIQKWITPTPSVIFSCRFKYEAIGGTSSAFYSGIPLIFGDAGNIFIVDVASANLRWRDSAGTDHTIVSCPPGVVHDLIVQASCPANEATVVLDGRVYGPYPLMNVSTMVTLVRVRSYASNQEDCILDDVAIYSGDVSLIDLVATAQETADQAIANAALAQGSADEKTTTFVQSEIPMAKRINDLWVDEGSENLILYSEQADNAYWNKSNCTISTPVGITPPLGTSAVSTLTESTDSIALAHYVAKASYPFIAGKFYVTSWKVKAAGRNNCRIALPSVAMGGAYRYAAFDLTTGELVASDSSLEYYKSVYEGDGWWTCSVGHTAVATTNSWAALIYTADAVGSSSYIGDGRDALYLTGAILVAEYAGITAYIPTTTDPVSTVGNNHLYRWDGSIWTSVQDAGISQALLDVAIAQAAADVAQAAADAAQIDATAANNILIDIADEDLLTPVEKPAAIQLRDQLTAEQAGIDAQADAYSIVTEKAAYDASLTALLAYLATLTVPVLWSATTGNTIIVRAEFLAAFNTVYAAKQALLNKIYDKTKILVTAAQTTADDAALAAAAAALAASTAQDAADDALFSLAEIVSNDLLTIDEKPRVIRDRDVLVAEQAGIDAQAVIYGITTEKTAYDTSITSLTTYLATLTTPALWSSLIGNTVIVGSAFQAAFVSVYAARQTLLNKIYEVTKALVTAAALTAVWSSVSGEDRPENGADVTATHTANDTTHVAGTLAEIVASNAADAMTAVTNMSADGWLSAQEKALWRIQWPGEEGNFNSVITQVGTYGLSDDAAVVALQASRDALYSYLSTTLLVWSAPTVATAISPDTQLRDYVDDYYTCLAEVVNVLTTYSPQAAVDAGVDTTTGGLITRNVTTGDYGHFTASNLYYYFWNGAEHLLYKTLRRSEQMANLVSGTTVQVPGYFKSLPSILTSPSEQVFYDKRFPYQSQTIICYPANISLANNIVTFKPVCELRLSTGQSTIGASASGSGYAIRDQVLGTVRHWNAVTSPILLSNIMSGELSMPALTLGVQATIQISTTNAYNGLLSCANAYYTGTTFSSYLKKTGGFFSVYLQTYDGSSWVTRASKLNLTTPQIFTLSYTGTATITKIRVYCICTTWDPATWTDSSLAEFAQTSLAINSCVCYLSAADYVLNYGKSNALILGE
jgi:hypothetical protein